jgi:hypothetical protein
MRAKVFVQLTVFLVLVIATTAFGETDQQRDFYSACLDWKISKCEAKSAVRNSTSTSLYHYAELNRHQADFYENNREALIQEMLNQGLTLKKHEVEHFLIKSFFHEYPKELVSR